ncbi:MAG: 50S ribosomal protein L14e [Thermoprotei archaeon]
MPIINVGSICVKNRGREAGRKCVVIDIIDENFVYITGPKSLTGVRRRKANVKHLEVTQLKIDIKRRATDEEVLKALESAKLIDEMKTPIKVG